MFTISEDANKEILKLLEQESEKGLALRITIAGRGPHGFMYELEFVPESDKRDDDVVTQAQGFKILIDAESAPNLDGAKLLYSRPLQGGSFRIENPNPLWRDPIAQKVAKVLDEQINPGVGMHGGFVSLVDVKDGIAYVAFGGGCHGCGMVDVTLKQGVEAMILQAVPEIRAVMDTTDHSTGATPYYRSGDDGSSPLT
jgi:Fe/S biogenesis protein NfuA